MLKLPTTPAGWVGLALVILTTAISGLQAHYASAAVVAPVWLPFVHIVITAVAGALGLKLLPVAAPKQPTVPPAAGVVLLCGLALGASSCSPNLATGYRAYALAVHAGNATGKTMAAVCKAKRLTCVAEYSKAVEDVAKAPAARVALKECLKGCIAAHKRWVTYVRPAYNSGLATTWAGLEMARLSGDGETDVLKYFKPPVCALALFGAEWSHVFGDKLRSIIKPVVALKGLVCP